MEVIIGPLEITLKTGTRDNSCGFNKIENGYEWFVCKGLFFDTGECRTLKEVFEIFKSNSIK